MTKYNESLTTREELVQTVKDLGQSVIEMAEDIVGDAKYLTDLDITLRVNTFHDCVPSIEIAREHAPAAYIRRWAGEENIK